MSKKILVTGGSGAVGKYVVDELVAHGHRVGVLDLQTPRRQEVAHHKVDVLDLPAVQDVVAGYEVVVHVAGIPHPLDHPAKQVFDVNVNGTFNMLEAAAQAGIQKLVFTSSESTLGFAFATHPLTPEYVPLDEQHPTRPQDPYGLSKVVCEQLCKTYSDRHGLRTVCLRAPWIWLPEATQLPFYRSLVADYPNWYKNLWTFVHANDVAAAHRLAVETDLPELHEAFFITAADNWTGESSRALIQRFYPSVAQFADGFSGSQAIISHAKAARLLGYAPQYGVDDVLSADLVPSVRAELLRSD